MKVIKIILAIIIAVFLIIGVPIIINECYKSNLGIVTVWTGADVLGYYGSILGSAIAVVTLIATIIFTKKQIQRESYLKSEGEKWDRLDNVFLEILDSINPIKVLQNVMDSGYNDPSKAINYLQKYQMSCKIACDQLNTHLNTDDYPKFKNLIDNIADLAEVLVNISQEEIEEYSNMRLWKHRNTALQSLSIEHQRPGTFEKEELDFNKDVLSKTESMTFYDIDTRIKDSNEKFIKIYECDYRALLQLKGATFESVRIETEKQADSILNLRKNNRTY